MNRLREKGSVQLKYSLVSNALCPVLDIDDATALKAVFRQNVLHHFVIRCVSTRIFSKCSKHQFRQASDTPFLLPLAAIRWMTP